MRARDKSPSSIAHMICRRSACRSSNACSPPSSRRSRSSLEACANQPRAVARNSPVTSVTSISVNPARRSRSHGSPSERTARGPTLTARRCARFERPGVVKIVRNAVRPPSRRSRRHALSTESLAVSQHRTSVWTIASKLSDANGSLRALATTAPERSAMPSRSARRIAVLSPSSGRSVSTTEDPVTFAR